MKSDDAPVLSGNILIVDMCRPLGHSGVYCISMVIYILGHGHPGMTNL